MCVEYNEDDLKRIIAEKEMVIAYYLVGKKSDSPNLDYQRNKAQTLFDAHQIK